MRIHLDRKSLKKASTRIVFYVKNFSEYALPDGLFRWMFFRGVRKLGEEDRKTAEKRASYYARIPKDANLQGGEKLVMVGDYKFPFGQKKRFSAYFFDLYRYVRLFDKEQEFCYLFGDVAHETTATTFVKSRPISSTYTRSVLINMDKHRHFFFIHDKISFKSKADKAVLRNVVRGQPHRMRLLDMWYGHPKCDFACVNTDVEESKKQYVRPYMSMEEQMKYKFILCIEGNDVATNLKWVMSSNSLAVMPKPKIESWFMEGTLIAGVHYVEINGDYSDLIDKIDYYIAHSKEAENIIENAHEYVAQFQNARLEDYTSYLTMERYFRSINKDLQ